MSYFRLTLNTDLDQNQLAEALRLIGQAVDGQQDLRKIAAFLEGNGSGRGLHVRFAKNGVRAAQTGTFTGDPTAAETITINGVVFTARASGAVANEYNFTAGNVTATAAALAAAINASTSAKIQNVIVASSALGVVTLTCLIPGALGNLCTLTEATSNFTVAGANLAGGSEDAEVLINAGRIA